MITTPQAHFIREFSKELAEENAAVFAGAGLSVGAGFVNWKELLKPIAEELGLDIEQEHDLIAIAQYHCNENGLNRSKLNQLLLHEFCQEARLTENHEILARLPIGTFWTTNYDKLIEAALEAAGKVADVKHSVDQLALTKPKRDSIVYKMHGDVDHPKDAVLTKDDYEKYHIKCQAFINALQGDLVSKTFLFLGFSFTDPNLDYVLSRIRATFADNQRRHFCFLKDISAGVSIANKDAHYLRRRQELFVGDLKRFNIKTIIIDDYNEITGILKEIERIYKSRAIWICGAAQEYGAMSREQAEGFIQELSKRLVDKGYRIISGFGLGVGGAVISGVLDHIYIKRKAKLHDQLVMRPFPQIPARSMKLPEIWRRYREDMATYAGTAIFLFGNKKVKNKIVDSDGLDEEFNIACENKLAVIPVGATGYVSARLWEQVDRDFSRFFPTASPDMRQSFKNIGNVQCSADTLINEIMKIIETIGKITN